MIEQWDPARHAELLAAWWGGPLDLRRLPKHGVVVDGCAAGFLYLTETTVAYIDSLITDPNAPRRKAHAALETVVSELCGLARGHSGVHILVGSSPFFGLRGIAERNGFNAAESLLFLKEV